MAVFRYPVLVLQAHQGLYTALLVEELDDQPISAAGSTHAKAVAQVEDYLRWFHKQHPYIEPLEFLEPRLHHQQVHIRPEYHHSGRRYPCRETLRLQVPIVQGRRASGVEVCAIPTLGVNFHYYQSDQLKETISHFVQDKLEGCSPRDLSRHLPVQSATLDEVLVPVGAKSSERTDGLSQQSPNLETVADPCSSLLKRYSQGWGRETHIAELSHWLNHEKANVILLGEPGVGKTTVLMQAIRKSERLNSQEQESSNPRTRKRFWRTSGSRLIAGMKYLGQWEQRCEHIIEELSGLGGVLCIENLLELVETGAGPGNSVARFFQTYIEQGELRLVAEATGTELQACRRLLPGFLELFQIVKVPTFNRQEALEVLDHLTAWHRQSSPVQVERGVTELIYRMFARFLPYQVFPGQATVFLRQLFEHAVQRRREKIAQADAISMFTQLTGLPEVFLKDEIPLDQVSVVQDLCRSVIGQEEAVRTAAGLVTTFKAGMNDPGRPVGSLLFCGPTGVGKTQLAKTLSQFLFGHGDQTNRLIRLDMSEYAGPDAAERFLHDLDNRPSKWIRRIRRQPFAVVLFDEIEKASPVVFDILLSVLDEGRVTDQYGRMTILRSAVIIMTSNLGGQKTGALGFGRGPGMVYEDEAEGFFRPEFLNRIDAIVAFEPLNQQTASAIVTKELTGIAAREGLVKVGVRLSWTEKLVQHMVEVGIDHRYGARPLQRALEAKVVGPLACFLLEHQGIQDRAVCIDIDEAGGIRFALRD